MSDDERRVRREYELTCRALRYARGPARRDIEARKARLEAALLRFKEAK